MEKTVKMDYLLPDNRGIVKALFKKQRILEENSKDSH